MTAVLAGFTPAAVLKIVPLLSDVIHRSPSQSVQTATRRFSVEVLSSRLILDAQSEHMLNSMAL